LSFETKIKKKKTSGENTERDYMIEIVIEIEREIEIEIED
jgi:hypothetical protein